MKLISFAVPCYNSEAYMRKCIDSLLKAGEDAEILIVLDGSVKDNTAAIADEYEAKYPTICRAIHQQNKGHGGACNAGMQNATGEYFKVVDSDDWLDENALAEYMKLLRGLRGQVDLFITNYVYEKQGRKNKMVMRFHDICPAGRLFAWKDVRTYRVGEVLTMHTMTYRTQLLRDCGLVLPEHTFYVDNIYAYLPLAFVKTLYYADLDLYRYFIGRTDQSVNQEIMVKRQDQQMRVMRAMIEGCHVDALQDERLKRYLARDLEMIMTITSVVMIVDGGEAALKKKDEIWALLREKNPEADRRIRRGILGFCCSSRNPLLMKFTMFVYILCQRIYGFN